MGAIKKWTDIAIADLVLYENNAKIHNKTQVQKIAASIQEFGFINPCLIDENKNVIAGHGRIAAALLLGMKEVPCLYVEGLTDDQRKAYILADNRLGELADWDMEKVASELQQLEDAGFDVSLTGFSLDEMIFEEPEKVREDDYEVSVPEETTIHRGQVYRLGRHRLMCGDSTSPDDVMVLMGGHLADMLLTDPPYNVNYEGGAGKIENDNMEDSEFREFLRLAFFAAKQNMKPGGAFHIWHADSEGYNFRGACRDVGLVVRQCLIWVKNSLVLGRQDFQWQHEPCLYGEKPVDAEPEEDGHEPCLYGWKEGSAHRWYKNRKQTTVMYFDKPTRSAEHPTMKPVLLFDYEMKCNTRRGDIVLDLFGGSGTTIMAAEQNGRIGYVMEYDPKYVDVIIRRWEDFTGEKAVLVSE